MAKDYLTWFKDLDARLSKSRGVHSLISSNVSEPLEMLEGLIRENAGELKRFQSHNNDWGHPVLKERVARRYGIKPENILLTNGCTNANFLAISTLVKPGNAVVCERPSYQPMWQAALLAGAQVRWLRRRPPDYGADPDELARLVDRRTSLVLLTNLHNPSGAAMDDTALREIVRAVRRRNPGARILVDEVFRDFVPGRRKPACTVDPLFISTGSLSKVYGLSHLECGWIVADRRTIDRVMPLFVLAEGNGSRYLESLSALVFSRLDEYLERSMRIIEANRRALRRAMRPLVSSGLIDQPVPETGCIWFPKLRGMRDAAPFCGHAARHHRVHVVPGSFFGDRTRFRVGFGGNPSSFLKSAKHLFEAVNSFMGRK